MPDGGLGLCFVRLHCAGTVLGDTISSFIGYNKVTLLRKLSQNSSPKTFPIVQFDTTPAQSVVKAQPQMAKFTGRLLHARWPTFVLE